MWPASLLQRLGHSWWKYHLNTYQAWPLSAKIFLRMQPFGEEENQTAAILFLTSSSLKFLGEFVGIEIKCDEVDEGKEKLHGEADEEDTLCFSKWCGICWTGLSQTHAPWEKRDWKALMQPPPPLTEAMKETSQKGQPVVSSDWSCWFVCWPFATSSPLRGEPTVLDDPLNFRRPLLWTPWIRAQLGSTSEQVGAVSRPTSETPLVLWTAEKRLKLSIIEICPKTENTKKKMKKNHKYCD